MSQEDGEAKSWGEPRPPPAAPPHHHHAPGLAAAPSSRNRSPQDPNSSLSLLQVSS